MQADPGNRALSNIVLCAGLLAGGLTLSATALAQPIPPQGVPQAAYPAPAYPPPIYPGAVYAAAPYPGPVYGGYGPALPPRVIVAIVRSTGLEPLTKPVHNGPAYALRAVDRAGRQLQVMVDARAGRIVRIVPVAGGYAGVPPAYGRPPGVAVVPDGYRPNSRIAALPPGGEAAPGARAPAVGAAVQGGPPPVPRPRPKSAAADTSAAPPAADLAGAPRSQLVAATKDIANAPAAAAPAVAEAKSEGSAEAKSGDKSESKPEATPARAPAEAATGAAPQPADQAGQE